MPYLILAIVLFLLGLLIRKVPLPIIEVVETAAVLEGKTSVFQFPNLWLGILALFVYVGAEVIARDTIIFYGISLGFKRGNAKYFTSYTLIALVAIYALGLFLIPK